MYCIDVARVLNHVLPSSSLWEAGHVLWRPAGYALSPVFLRLIPDRLAWTPALKIGYGLTLLSLLCGLAGSLLVYDLSRRLMRNPLAALVPVALFVWGDGVLAYSQSSSSYIAGLFLLLAGIWWEARAPGFRGAAAVPAVLFGMAGLFWLPYVIAIPAACAAPKILPMPETADRNISWSRVLLSCCGAAAVVGAGLLLAAVLAGIHSPKEFVAWALASGHGMRQNRQAIRAVTGCSRLFLDLGADTIYLKRFLFHDPYHHVGRLELIRRILWRPAVFYIFMAAVFWATWHSPRGRRSLALLSLCGVPALAAAILVFEPSSPERFFPVLPFLLLAVAAGWEGQWRGALWARCAVCLFAVLLPAMNGPTFIGRFSQWHQVVAEQVTEFRSIAAPGDALLGVLLSEPIIDLATQHPFDSLNRPREIPSTWAVDLMNVHAAQWPTRVARFVLDNWREGRATWLEKAALADAPSDRLLWAEGDNPNVRWRDVPAFFRTLEFDRESSGADGFVRIAQSAGNEARFRGLTEGTESEKVH